MSTLAEPRSENWDDLRFVLALQRHGSIAAAARSLSVTEVTVSRRLRQVEDSLGTRLFDRERGVVTPTREALTLVERLTTIGDEIDALRDSIGGADREVAGLVRLTCVTTLMGRVIVPRMSELLDAYPALELELIVDNAQLGVTYQRETDIAIRLQRPVSEPDALIRKIGDLPCGIYCQRDLDGTDPRLGWVVYAQRCASVPHARWIEEQRLAEQGIVRVRVDGAEELLRCVRTGLGKTLLGVPFAHRFPELMRLDDGYSVPTREMWMIMHPSSRDVRRLSVVAEWLTELLRDFLKEPEIAGD